MLLRPFGSTGLRVSEVGLGCARIGGIFQSSTAGLVELIGAVADAGINFFDTSDMYSQGESEALLGRALQGRRSGVVIATKSGYRLPAQRRLTARLKPLVRPLIKLIGLRRESLPSLVRGAPSQDFSAAYLTSSLEGSLRRLRTDYVDLFQLHSPPADVVERAEFVEALERLRTQGKIRFWGISCDSEEAALTALRLPGIASVQILLNLLEAGALAAVVPQARALGVAIVARECLANGLLVKGPGEVALAAYCGSQEKASRLSARLAELHARAQQSGVPLARAALQFVLGQPGVSVALLGMRTRQQLDANLGLWQPHVDRAGVALADLPSCGKAG